MRRISLSDSPAASNEVGIGPITFLVALPVEGAALRLFLLGDASESRSSSALASASASGLMPVEGLLAAVVFGLVLPLALLLVGVLRGVWTLVLALGLASVLTLGGRPRLRGVGVGVMVWVWVC